MATGYTGRSTGGFPALGVGGEMRKGPGGGIVACYTKNSACSLHDYCTVNSTNDELINATDLARAANNTFPPPGTPGWRDATKIVMSPMADEPKWYAPINTPVATSSIVKLRWHTYLQAHHMAPTDFGESSWDAVLPNLGRGDAGAGNTSAADSPLALPKRRLFYHSVRFSMYENRTCVYRDHALMYFTLTSGAVLALGLVPLHGRVDGGAAAGLWQPELADLRQLE